MIFAISISLIPASSLAQSPSDARVEHRAYGAMTLGAPRPQAAAAASSQVPRSDAPLWPSASPVMTNPSASLPPVNPQQAPTGRASSWQQSPAIQPVSLDPTRPPPTQQRRVVSFTHAYPPGSLIIVNRERALYHVGEDGRAVRYPVAIGSFTEEWTGVEFVTDKKQNPTWYPVQLPGTEPREPVPGTDPANPLGARALYLGRTLWRIHGTPASNTIGQAVSNGCIRMHNEHVIELYDKIVLGTEVYAVDRLADAAPGHRGKKVIE